MCDVVDMYLLPFLIQSHQRAIIGGCLWFPLPTICINIIYDAACIYFKPRLKYCVPHTQQPCKSTVVPCELSGLEMPPRGLGPSNNRCSPRASCHPDDDLSLCGRDYYLHVPMLVKLEDLIGFRGMSADLHPLFQIPLFLSCSSSDNCPVHLHVFWASSL